MRGRLIGNEPPGDIAASKARDDSRHEVAIFLDEARGDRDRDRSRIEPIVIEEPGKTGDELRMEDGRPGYLEDEADIAVDGECRFLVGGEIFAKGGQSREIDIRVKRGFLRDLTPFPSMDTFAGIALEGWGDIGPFDIALIDRDDWVDREVRSPCTGR